MCLHVIVIVVIVCCVVLCSHPPFGPLALSDKKKQDSTLRLVVRLAISEVAIDSSMVSKQASVVLCSSPSFNGPSMSDK